MTVRMLHAVGMGLAVAVLALTGRASGDTGLRTTSSTVRASDPITACTARQTRSALGKFVVAFSAGDYRRLNSLFAASSWFRWYSSSVPGERFDPEAQKRQTLIAYFRSRHAHRDRLRLVSFRFNGNSLGYGNFIWKMRRSAGDFRDGAWFTVEAKGAAVCSGARVRFVVMSLGEPEPLR